MPCTLFTLTLKAEKVQLSLLSSNKSRQITQNSKVVYVQRCHVGARLSFALVCHLYFSAGCVLFSFFTLAMSDKCYIYIYTEYNNLLYF